MKHGASFWCGVFFVYMDDTQIHLPAAEAPVTTGEFARCKVCNCQWQIKAYSDKLGCAFCGAENEAVIVINEDVD